MQCRCMGKYPSILYFFQGAMSRCVHGYIQTHQTQIFQESQFHDRKTRLNSFHTGQEVKAPTMDLKMLGCLTQALLKMIFPTWDMLVPCTPLKWCKVCQVRWIRGLEMEADFWRGKLSLNPEENVSLERLKKWLSTGEVPWTLPGDDLCHYLKDARRTGRPFFANLPLWV